MTTLLQISVSFSAFNTLHDDPCKKLSFFGSKLPQPINCHSLSKLKIGYVHRNGFRVKAQRERWSLWRGSRDKDGSLEREWRRRNKMVVLVRFNQRFGFNGGGNGGGGDNSANVRLVGNIAFAVALTYLSMTGQLGWLLDAIVSIWLIAVLLPIVGLGAFLWWAGRDIVQGTCPNCGNDFQIFKSSLNEELQLCPFCSQPFSVVGNEFVRDSVKFSNKATTFEQIFNDFSPRSKKGKESSTAVVDVEAEIKDAD